MLIGVDPVLTPDALKALAEMGHGDVVDAHFPSAPAAASSGYGRLIRFDGADSARAVRGVLSVLPLDTDYGAAPAERMQVDGEPGTLPHAQREVQLEVDAAVGRPVPLVAVPRPEFYQRARQVYAVIRTGELRGWGCFLLRKGLTNLRPDAPRD